MYLKNRHYENNLDYFLIYKYLRTRCCTTCVTNCNK